MRWGLCSCLQRLVQTRRELNRGFVFDGGPWARSQRRGGERPAGSVGPPWAALRKHLAAPRKSISMIKMAGR